MLPNANESFSALPRTTLSVSHFSNFSMTWNSLLSASTSSKTTWSSTPSPFVPTLWTVHSKWNDSSTLKYGIAPKDKYYSSSWPLNRPATRLTHLKNKKTSSTETGSSPLLATFVSRASPKLWKNSAKRVGLLSRTILAKKDLHKCTGMWSKTKRCPWKYNLSRQKTSVNGSVCFRATLRLRLGLLTVALQSPNKTQNSKSKNKNKTNPSKT